MTETKPEANTDRRHPPFVIQFAVWLVVWTLLGLLFASQQVSARPLIDGTQITWLQAIPEAMLYSFYWGFTSLAVFRVVKLYPLGRQHLLRNCLIHAALALVVSMGYVVICVIIAPNETLIAARPMTVFDRFITFSSLFLHTNLLIYLMVMLAGHVVAFYQRLKDREIAASRIQAQLVSAHLNELKAQLNPHFLFNTLSAITTLIHEDPEKAETMTVRLSQLLRMSLESGSEHKRSLAEELDFLRKYVEIQTVRFGDRVRYAENIDQDVESAMIPTLMLHPLVENAFIHGAGQSTSVCNIELNVTRVDSKLSIQVADDGPGKSEIAGTGIGLPNTQNRLRQLYGDEFRFATCDKNGFKVEIEIPLERS